jgi:CheY-like chemotaxis protein
LLEVQVESGALYPINPRREQTMQPKERMKLGEILIQQKILTPLIVERIIRISDATHRRFGKTLEDMGLLTGEELAQALAVQFGYKILSNICQFNIPRETLMLIPEEEAFENRVFPLQVKEGRLALAMADPTNEDYTTSLASRLALKVVPFIATTQDIMKAIAKNYLGDAPETYADSILVVDTDGRERDSVVSPLSGEGYHVVEAVDATDGLHLALLHLPSLVITAKEMPDSDGFAFFTTLQGVAETGRIPVILLSQRASAEEEAAAFQRGFFDYIPMPTSDIVLINRVRRALGAGRTYIPHRPGQASLNIQ